MNFFEVIKQSGYGNIVQFLVLAGSMIFLLYNTFNPNPLSGKEVGVALTVILAAVGQLLYSDLKNRKSPNRSVSILPSLKGKDFERLMSRPGKKRILNTWIFNICELTPLLAQALKDERTQVEICVLKPTSPHAETRGIELNHTGIVETIKGNLNALARFVSELPDDQKLRVKVFEYDSAPKFLIHGCGEAGFVGFFWVGDHAAHGEQIILEENGPFSKNIWDYYESLAKRDITKSLLS